MDVELSTSFPVGKVVGGYHLLAAFVLGVGEAWFAASNLLQNFVYRLTVFEFMFAEQVLEVLVSAEG